MCALFLAKMGFSLKLIDGDFVEESNIKRQPLFSSDQVGHSKVEAIKERFNLMEITRNIRFINEYLDSNNIDRLLENEDFVLDATDSFLTRELINEFAVKNNKPWMYTSSNGTMGQFKLVIPGETSCLECITNGKEMRPIGCHFDSVEPEIPSTVSLFATNKIRKFISGDFRDGSLFFFDLKEMTIEKIEMRKNEKCGICMGHNFKKVSTDKITGRQLY